LLATVAFDSNLLIWDIAMLDAPLFTINAQALATSLATPQNAAFVQFNHNKDI
ncbi:MAG: hypothetical protein MHPSP_001308, partial [Paramarteilia canceri]